MEEPPPRNPLFAFIRSLHNIFDGPVTFFREKIVEPNQKTYPYYHQKFRRVPTVDQCLTDDAACIWEAQMQFERDSAVDDEILNILRQRHEHCMNDDYNQRQEPKCMEMEEYYEEAAAAWFTKYGDLGAQPKVEHALMKQKHRMAWERRHGPVGTGMKEGEKYKIDEKKKELVGQGTINLFYHTYKDENGNEYFKQFKPRPYYPIDDEDEYNANR